MSGYDADTLFERAVMKMSAHRQYYEIAMLVALVFLFCHRIFVDFGKFGIGDWISS